MHMCKIHCSFNLPKIPESVYGFIYPLQLLWASLVAQLVKKSTCNSGDPGLIPGSGRSPGERIGYLLQ